MAIPNEPLTRVEQYLNNIAVGEGTIPEEPLTRTEQYLDYIAKNGGGGSGGDPEAIASAVTDWLEENVDPVGSAVVVDSSLSIEGAAADAKVTGNAIGGLKIANRQLYNDSAVIVEQGYWSATDGKPVSQNNWCRSATFVDEDYILTLSSDNDKYMHISAYEKVTGTYVGMWNGTAQEFNTTYDSEGSSLFINIIMADWVSRFPNYLFKISFSGTGADFTPSYIYSILTVTNRSKGKHEEEYYPASIYYEHGEVGVSPINSYTAYQSEARLDRARTKKEYLQTIPEGATSCTFSIPSQIFVGGKYKVGFAFYDSNYGQIPSSILGWYTYAVTKTVTVPTNAKYYMFYYAVNSASQINIDEIPNEDTTVFFDNDRANYSSLLASKSYILEKNMEKESETIDEIGVTAKNETFIYSVNHRGYSIEAPENTIPAYVLSKKKGFTYAECDICFTSDVVCVLLHDPTINRTARNADGSAISSTINIGDITYAQALQYDFGIWKGQQWAGTNIPTLEQFLIACKNLSLHPFIELKDVVNGTYWTDSRIASVAETIKNVGMENHVSFISFAVSSLEKISVYFPKARLGLGFEGTYTESNFAAYITNAQTLLSDEHETICTVSYAQMTDTLYDMLTNAGIKPLIWTVNTESVVLSMNKTVIGVLSDSLNAGDILLQNMLNTV